MSVRDSTAVFIVLCSVLPSGIPSSKSRTESQRSALKRAVFGALSGALSTRASMAKTRERGELFADEQAGNVSAEASAGVRSAHVRQSEVSVEAGPLGVEPAERLGRG